MRHKPFRWVLTTAMLFAALTATAGDQPASASITYSSQILSDGPSIYWRLGDAPGATTAVDSSGHGVTGTVTATPTFGAPGAIAGDSDTSMTSNASAQVSISPSISAPNTFTEEAWFQTTSTSGGTLTGFFNTSITNLDRVVWMDNTGHLVYGNYPSGVKTVTSPNAYNNGIWHMEAATLSASGMILYVDGVQVASDPTVTTSASYTGGWLVGGYNTGGWPDAAANTSLVGQIDEAAFWNSTALSAQQIQTEYANGEGGYAGSNVTSTVDPMFALTVTNKATACNGETGFSSSAGGPSAVTLGHVGDNSVVSGAQTLTITGNAANGFAVYVRGVSATGNFHSTAATWTDTTGTYATPAYMASGEAFGFTYSDSTTSSSVTNPASAKFIALSNATTNKAMGSTSSATGSGCIAFEARTGTVTKAGTYSATAIYTAVPSF